MTSVMEGFDPRWGSPEGFVLGVTRAIWEDRGIAALLRHYAPNIVVRSPASVVVGNRGVIAATMATLAEFPDRELPGEDVIWCEAGPGAFLSSHRLICWATHAGDGAYGRATGRRLRYRILADCHARADRIDDEWLVRDQGAILRQMGRDPVEWTRTQIAREGGPEACAKPLTPRTDRPGPYRGRGNGSEWGARHADLLGRIMAADMAAIPRTYDRAAHLHLPGHQDAHGHQGADRFWMALRAAFPDADFAVHHAIGREDPGLPPRSALRWSLWGRHSGWGAFGEPSGAEVYVLGISHAEWGPFGSQGWGQRRDWTLYDETAIWRQILLHRGDL